MKTKEAIYAYCLRLADNNMVLAQRLAEWCSRGPILEEDLALTNISLDLLGQAENFYGYAAAIKGNAVQADDLAFLRTEREYYNNLLVEQPNGDFAFTMMKQLLFAAFAKLLYEGLITSNDSNLQSLAAKGLKEVKYHLRHSADWIVRFGNGTEDSASRAQFALNELWRYTDDLFEMNAVDAELIDAGISLNLKDMQTHWTRLINEVLTDANLNIPENVNVIKGGCNGMHTEHLGHLLCEMQYLQRAHPGASW